MKLINPNINVPVTQLPTKRNIIIPNCPVIGKMLSMDNVAPIVLIFFIPLLQIV